MAVVKSLIQLGNSRAVVLPKPFLDQLDLTQPDAQVEVTLEDDRIVITPRRYATAEEARRAARHVVTKHRRLMERLARR